MTAKVWDAKTTGAEVLTLKGHAGDVLSASFNPEGSRVVTTDGDTAKVWNAKTGAEILAIKGHAGSVHRASFSPDGSRIITACGDICRLGESRPPGAIVGGQDRRRGPHAQGAHRHASIRPRSARTVHGSSPAATDRTVKVWNAKTGAEVLTLKGHTAIVSSASFSPNGSRIVTGELTTGR